MRAHFDEPQPGAANHMALSPLSFLHRAATVYADVPATTLGPRSGWQILLAKHG